MAKEYSRWHSKKTSVDAKSKRVFFHEREIWSCHIGANVGFEEDGRGIEFLRPAVIIKKFNNELCWVVPLTRTTKDGIYYFVFNFDKEATSAALLSQMKPVDAKRLKYKMGAMEEADFSSLKQKIKRLLD